MMPQQLRKYNPGFLTDAELVDTFCVRRVEFESLLEVLRGCTGAANQPQIVIGPRGSGKTTLLLRVAAEVRRHPALSARFFPVVFAEESYEVSSAGEFWLECLSQLADRAPSPSDGPDLHRTVEAVRADPDDRSLADRCLGALLDFADREDKRLVLFVENLNMLFRDMADPAAGWRLREVLQTEPRIVLIASATNRFAEIDRRDRAFHDLFRICELRPVSTEECKLLWETLSGRSVDLLQIRSLEILTGGSPRLLMIVARFGSGRSFRTLLTDLLELVDDHTEYFKSHIESLPAQERRVYLALAELWRPSMTREIAARSRLDTSTCSAQLKRLADRGVVRTAGGTARRKTYYLTERLYNIYYLLRRRRGDAPLVEALIRFMQSLYRPSEIKEITMQMLRDLEQLDPRMLVMYHKALALLVPRRPSPAWEAAVEIHNRGIDLVGRNRLDEAISAWDEVVFHYGTTQDPAVLGVVAMALNNKAGALGQLNRPADALAAADDLVRRFGDSTIPALQEQVAKSLVNRGAALATLGRREEALTSWQRVESHFGATEETELHEAVAMALVNRAGVLSTQDRLQDVCALLDEVVRRFHQHDEPAVLHQVAIALVNKGAALRGANRLEEALAAWQDVVRRFGQKEIPEVGRQVAMALVNAGTALDDLDRTEDALASWAEVVRRYGDSSEPPLLETVGRALGNTGLVLSKVGREEDAVAACDEIVQRFAGSEAAVLRERTAHALVLKGGLLGKLNRRGDALAAFGGALQIAGDASETMRRLKDLALLGRADIQLSGHDYGAVIETVGRVVDDGRAKSAEVLWRACALRAHAALLQADMKAAVRDITELLKIARAWDAPPPETIQSLLILTVGVGMEKMLRLIEASPAKTRDFLLPLAIALRCELGESPRVAVEVEEVAQDLRRNLAEIRQTNPDLTP